MGYQPFQTGPFERKFRKLDKPVRERVQKDIMEKLCDDPYRNSTALSGELWGLRSFHSGKFRVILIIVEEAEKLEIQNTRPEFNCDGLPPTGIKLLEIGPRKNIYNT